MEKWEKMGEKQPFRLPFLQEYVKKYKIIAPTAHGRAIGAEL